jgi:hypothetical protein
MYLLKFLLRLIASLAFDYSIGTYEPVKEANLRKWSQSKYNASSANSAATYVVYQQNYYPQLASLSQDESRPIRVARRLQEAGLAIFQGLWNIPVSIRE